MFKKLLAMSLSVILLLGITPTAFATDRTDTATNFKADSSESITVDELIEHLNSIDFGREVTFTSLPQSRSSDQELIHFDSVEAVEAYLKQFINEQRELAIPIEAIVQNTCPQRSSESIARANTGWYNTTVWWWGGGNTSIASLTNAEITFYYNSNGGGSVSNITLHNSYVTGIVAATWTHRRGTGTALGGMDTKYSVTGTWFIGVDVLGFPLGASFDETLTSPTITIKMDSDF